MPTPLAAVAGEWRIDDKQRVCTTLRIGSEPGQGFATIILPTRCQFWFRLGEKYFLAESDYDRGTKVLVRTFKR